jgi:hypothetical protein
MKISMTFTRCVFLCHSKQNITHVTHNIRQLLDVQYTPGLLTISGQLVKLENVQTCFNKSLSECNLPKWLTTGSYELA